MSILIKDMEMPECCEVCPCYNWIEDICRITESPNDFSDARIEDCPLVEVSTPHGRLIDADAIMDLLEKSVPEKNRGHQFYVFRHMLRNAPTVIEAEE